MNKEAYGEKKAVFVNNNRIITCMKLLTLIAPFTANEPLKVLLSRKLVLILVIEGRKRASGDISDLSESASLLK